MLSNTAVPKYYGEFRDAVIRGEIPVCETISMEMNRIDELIDNPGVYYDEEAVEGFIKFCENECTLADGGEVHLLPSFKLWAEQLYGWYYFVTKSVYEPNPDGPGGQYVKKTVKKRLTKKQYLIVARGAAKTMYDGFIHNYHLNVDTSTTDQITVAPTMRQAEEVLKPIATSIIQARGPLFKMLTEGSIQNTTGSASKRVKLASTKKGIQNFLTGSILQIVPWDIDKLQGSKCKVATIDEWLSGETKEDPVGAIEQGCQKNDQDYVIVATSSEGTIRNGCGDSMKMELMEILKGNFKAPHVSIWYYRLDDIKEVEDPDMWIKANPNIGKTVSYESYQMDVERMNINPSVKNDILAKRFGIPTEGYTYFFRYEETIPHSRAEFWRMPCSMGADMSQGDDFCAFTFLFPLQNGNFGVKTRSYITSLTLSRLSRSMRIKYQEFMDEGSLMVMDGTVLEMDKIYDDVNEFIERNQFDVLCFGYDPYNAREFVERWIQENSEFGVEKVAQGAKTETVPLGELKKLAEERMLLFDQELMSFAMGNAVTIEDTNGNRKLFKKRRDEKIDNVSALMDAYVAYKLHKEDFE